MKKQNTPKVEIPQRRQYARIPVAYIVRSAKMTLSAAAKASIEKSATQNISAGGSLFQSQTKFNVGDVLKLEIVIPGWERFKTEFYRPGEVSGTKPLVVVAQVVRIEEVVPGKAYDVGVRFAGIDPDHQNALVKFILSQSEKGIQ